MAAKKRGKRGHWLPVAILLLLVVGVPLGVVAFEAQRRGTSIWGLVKRLAGRAVTESTGLEGVFDSSLPRPRIDFLESRTIGEVFDPDRMDYPKITHLVAVDLDRDGLLDVVACDATKNRVVWIRQAPADTFTEIDLGEEIASPAHVEAVDFEGDGDLDLVVAGLGVVPPSNDRIGTIHLLENDGDMVFADRLVLDKVARVSDVRAADLDGDGDLDLAVAQFGYDDGEIRWLENLGGLRFTSHILQNLSGPINIVPVDLDDDGDLDLVSVVSQEWEEIYAFLNDGRGGFTTKLLYGCSNEDFGSSGIRVADLDQDGDLDILFTNGDAFDYIPPRPRPWHGVQWFENQGDLEFVLRRIGDLAGAYGGIPADLDGDGDLDVLAVSSFNIWSDPHAQSIVWFENDGGMRFARRNLANDPTHVLAADLGDFDGDGWMDLVTGGMHIYAPYDRVGRILLWRNRWPEATEK